MHSLDKVSTFFQKKRERERERNGCTVSDFIGSDAQIVESLHSLKTQEDHALKSIKRFVHWAQIMRLYSSSCFAVCLKQFLENPSTSLLLWNSYTCVKLKRTKLDYKPAAVYLLRRAVSLKLETSTFPHSASSLSHTFPPREPSGDYIMLIATQIRLLNILPHSAEERKR